MRGALIAIVLLAGCSSEPDPVAPLNAQDQEARFAECMAKMTEYQSAGVWLTGGARPIVDEEKFEALPDAERQSFIETAACVGKAGQVGPTVVDVVAPGRSTPFYSGKAENRP